MAEDSGEPLFIPITTRRPALGTDDDDDDDESISRQNSAMTTIKENT